MSTLMDGVHDYFCSLIKCALHRCQPAFVSRLFLAGNSGQQRQKIQFIAMEDGGKTTKEESCTKFFLSLQHSLSPRFRFLS
jgi:hypothetical protein